MLPVRPTPISGESLAGYVVRVAERNGMESWHSLFTHAGIRAPSPQSLRVLLVDQAQLPALSRFIGVPLEPVARLGYQAVPNLTKIRAVIWRGFRVPTAALRDAQAPLCPQCVRESPHLRQEWDWRFVAACPDHGRLLLDRCPACGSAIARARASVSCCPCGFDFTAAVTPQVDVRGVRWLQSVTATVPASDDGARLNLFAELTAIWCDEANLECDPTAHCSAALDAANKAANAASEVIERGTNAPALRALVSRRAARWPELGPVAAVLPFLRLSQPELCGLDAMALRQQSVAPATVGSVSPQEIEGIRVCAETATRLMGVSMKALDAAIRAGVFYVGSKSDKRWRDRSIAATEIAAVLDALRPRPNLSHPKETRPAHGRQYSLASLLQGIRDRTLEVLSYDPRDGLGSAELRRPVAIGNVDAGLSVAAFARQLSVHPELLYGLIRGGHLPTTRTAAGHRIALADAAAFNRDFVFPRELATRHGATAFTVARKLVKLGIKPAFSPGTSKSTVYVFYRRDVESVPWAKLDAVRGLTIRKRLRPVAVRVAEVPPALLTARQASDEFGLSVQQLASLARSGYLVRHAAPKAPTIRRYFSRPEVARYLSRYRDNLDLVPLAEAAKAVGETVSAFTIRWAPTGLARVIDAGIAKYVSKEDLARVMARKAAYLTVLEVAKLLGTDRQSVANWIRCGWLKADHGPTIDGTARYLVARERVESVRERMLGSPASRIDFLAALGVKRRRRA